METFHVLYGGAFLQGFFSTLLCLALILLLERVSFVQKKAHHTNSRVLRFGGAALIVGFLFSICQSHIEYFPTTWFIFFGVLLLALFFGILDDLKNISWRWQLVVQIFLVSLLYFGGIRIDKITQISQYIPVSEGMLWGVGFILFLIWGILVMNALNWLDGIDGLSGSILGITFFSLFLLSLSPHVYQPPIAILLAVALGATLAFLVYNFPPAKIIAGTAGTLFFSIIIIFLSAVAGTKIATILLVLMLPILDTAFVLLKRILQKRSLFTPDKEHLHHILRARGWSDTKIVLWYGGLTLLISVIALHTQDLGKLAAILVVFVFVALLFFSFHFNTFFPRKLSFTLGALSLLVLGYLLNSMSDGLEKRSIFVSGQWFQGEVAQTELEKEVGLSKRNELCARCGMIFIFPQKSEPAFWMKDMRFSIDILWIADNKVIAKNENLPYPSLETFKPPSPIDTVVELPVGAARNIPLGATVIIW